MRTQSEADIIGEEMGDLVRFVERRQKQPCKVLHDSIHDCHAWNKFQIGDP
jgi:hypothetical protein